MWLEKQEAAAVVEAHDENYFVRGQKIDVVVRHKRSVSMVVRRVHEAVL
jgi:hypothetical protein